MVVKESRTTEEIVLSVAGELDLTSIDSFKIAMNKALEECGEVKFVIDLQQTDYIDSAGLEQLLVANRRLGTIGDRLIVRVKPNSQPQTVLMVAGFGTVMDIEPLTAFG